jgi:hypothetical protein
LNTYILVDRPIELDPVFFGDLVTGRDQTVNELMIVGDEHQSRGVFIQTARNRWNRSASHPLRRQQIVNARSFILTVGTDESNGFMELDEQTLGKFNRFAVDEDPHRVNFICGTSDRSAVTGQSAPLDP